MPVNASLESCNPFKQKYGLLLDQFDRMIQGVLKQFPEFKVIIQYQCEFQDSLANPDSFIGQYYHDHEIPGKLPKALILRQAVKGGMCDSFTLYDQAKPKKRGIYYYDINS